MSMAVRLPSDAPGQTEIVTCPSDRRFQRFDAPRPRVRAATPSRKKAGAIMDNSNTDQAKGRIKQAAGDLTGDRDLKREGKADEVAGKAKQAVGDMKDKA